MTGPAAESLAVAVRSAAPGAHVVVQPDGGNWLVRVETTSAGTFRLYDEDDWKWLRPQILGGMSAT